LDIVFIIGLRSTNYVSLWHGFTRK